jgi:hypothetical protein
MPNWAYSKVTFMGDINEVSRLKEQVSQPYQDPHNPERTIEGVFLLWNIVKPTNLSAYLGEEQKAFDEIVKADPELAELNQLVTPEPENIMATIMRQMETSDSWYEWNCRNWGTKWDTVGDKAKIARQSVEYLTDLYNDDLSKPMPANLHLEYRMESAWSPPIEALQALADQYPDVVISLESIDESDNFAMSAQWFRIPVSPSEFVPQFVEQDEEITHELGMELRGYCNLDCCNDYE